MYMYIFSALLGKKERNEKVRKERIFTACSDLKGLDNMYCQSQWLRIYMYM